MKRIVLTRTNISYATVIFCHLRNWEDGCAKWMRFFFFHQLLARAGGSLDSHTNSPGNFETESNEFLSPVPIPVLFLAECSDGVRSSPFSARDALKNNPRSHSGWKATMAICWGAFQRDPDEMKSPPTGGGRFRWFSRLCVTIVYHVRSLNAVANARIVPRNASSFKDRLLAFNYQTRCVGRTRWSFPCDMRSFVLLEYSRKQSHRTPIIRRIGQMYVKWFASMAQYSKRYFEWQLMSFLMCSDSTFLSDQVCLSFVLEVC